MASKKRQQPRQAPQPGVPDLAVVKSILTRPERPAVQETPYLPPLDSEWLEVDGCGGFASGTVSGIRTRRTHALLLVATPRAGSAASLPERSSHRGFAAAESQIVLVNGMDARVTTPRGVYELSSHRYGPEVIHPDGMRRIESFVPAPWPTWVYHHEDGTRIEHELFAVSGAPGVILTWAVVDGPARGVHLAVRPLISGREADALHHENPHCRVDAMSCDTSVRWQPYDGIPPVLAGSNGSYAHHLLWYKNFIYTDDRARGMDHVEDLASPGTFLFDLSRGEAVLVLTTDEGLNAMKSAAASRAAGLPGFLGATSGDPDGALQAIRENERAHRQSFPSRLHRAADAFVIRRQDRTQIVPCYPRGESGTRDVLLAARGILIATGRLDEARQFLLELSNHLSEGMLPRVLPAAGEEPDYNAVDTSLWYVIAVQEYVRAASASRRRAAAADRKALEAASLRIVTTYADGTRHGIHMDDDGLLRSGEPGSRLTWMDGTRGDEAVTPRAGKPVEVQALWLNALRGLPDSAPQRWRDAYERGRNALERRYWNEPAGCLVDVVDLDHVQGAIDASMRPNQILAVGGLPFALIEGNRAHRLVEAVAAKLLTPLGLRTLAPDSQGYAARYEGNVFDRRAIKHQGLVWPWLLGPFVEAWVRVRGHAPEAKLEARERFLMPLLAHLKEAGLGHISELADAEPPLVPGGCPFFAPSVGEALRLDQVVLRP